MIEKKEANGGWEMWSEGRLSKKIIPWFLT